MLLAEAATCPWPCPPLCVQALPAPQPRANLWTAFPGRARAGQSGWHWTRPDPTCPVTLPSHSAYLPQGLRPVLVVGGGDAALHSTDPGVLVPLRVCLEEAVPAGEEGRVGRGGGGQEEAGPPLPVGTGQGPRSSPCQEGWPRAGGRGRLRNTLPAPTGRGDSLGGRHHLKAEPPLVVRAGLDRAEAKVLHHHCERILGREAERTSRGGTRNPSRAAPPLPRAALPPQSRHSTAHSRTVPVQVAEGGQRGRKEAEGNGAPGAMPLPPFPATASGSPPSSPFLSLTLTASWLPPDAPQAWDSLPAWCFHQTAPQNLFCPKVFGPLSQCPTR